MAQTAFASMHDSADGISWSYCDSPAYNESGLAMYIEQESLSWSEQVMTVHHSMHFQSEVLLQV